MFILLVGILLITFNVNAIKKEKNSFNDMLENRYNHIDNIDIIIGELRKEFTENIFELQKEIEELKGNKEVKKSSNVLKKEDDNNIKPSKVKEIGDLLNQGKGVEEIANMLNVGKGEVLLIQELYLK